MDHPSPGLASGDVEDRGVSSAVDRSEHQRCGESRLRLQLPSRGGIGDQGFLERMARSDELTDHDGEACGQCCNMILGAEVAREMIEAGEYEDVASKWAAEHKRRWEKSKFFKLWEKEKKAGRDPRKTFKDRGWEP